MTRCLILFALCSSLLIGAHGQSEKPPEQTSEEPVIAGFWTANLGGTYSLTNPRRGGGRLKELLAEKKGKALPTNPSRIVDPPDGQIPYQPWAAARQKDILIHIDEPNRPEYIDPQSRCLPDGPIRSIFWSDFEIQQFPGYVVLIYDQNHPFRVIPLDGPPHPEQNIKLWMGDSRGHWERNTLVVDVTNNNSKSRLSNEGDFASDKLHIVERYTFLDANNMTYEATMDDPTVYTRPWTIRASMHRAHRKEPGYEQWENTCHEGERDADIVLAGVPAQAAEHKK